MEIHHLNSLRLGFSTNEASQISQKGLKRYIASQLDAQLRLQAPDFIKNGPKNLKELRELKQMAASGGKDLENAAKDFVKISFAWKAFVVQQCFETAHPLREKIHLFFQNHFVATLQSVKVPYWIFKYYETIQKHALGNYKTLVREVVYSNAMIKYLDNQQNRKGKINENLARELLELFTLGEGHYSENDIKQVALSLAGLTFGPEKGQYRPVLQDHSTKTVFGKSGKFIIDDVIEIIFEQENTPYFLAEKALKWFFYDNPSPALVSKYGKLLKDTRFELKPFFQQLFEQECHKTEGGQQIKNPLVFAIQVHKGLSLTPNYTFLAFFLKNQSMDIFDQPNVKGWKGGQDWLTSQIYADRKQLVDFIIADNPRYEKMLNKRLEKFGVGRLDFAPKLVVKNSKTAKAIIEELTGSMVFATNDEMLSDLRQLLPYDFDPSAENADKTLLKVYQYLAKSPEFQII